jgi:hypothetical protein
MRTCKRKVIYQSLKHGPVSGTAIWKGSYLQTTVLGSAVGNGRWGIIGFAINTERLVLDYSGKLFLECPKMTVAQRTQTGANKFEIY